MNINETMHMRISKNQNFLHAVAQRKSISIMSSYYNSEICWKNKSSIKYQY